MTSSWFPRPQRVEQVQVLDPSASVGRAEAFALLYADDARELREKVGVAGPNEGSAKDTTRLLASGGWVAKTNIDLATTTAEAARRWIAETRARGEPLAVWHPAKTWMVVQADGLFYPMTLCPEMRTLRRCASRAERFRAWVQMLRLGAETAAEHRVGLDLNPANFGYVEGDPRLYYLDDEVYEAPSDAMLAGALVARIPEERSQKPEDFRRLGGKLVAEVPLRHTTWTKVSEEIERYPLPARFESSRRAVLAGISAGREKSRTQAHGLTCVFADVHANLPALEAVLQDAKRKGAVRYLFLGDAVGYGPHPAACIERIANLPALTMVRGNHDHAVSTGTFSSGVNPVARTCAEWTRTVLDANALAWLADMPADVMQDTWMAVHGAPRDPRRFLAYVYELTYEDNLAFLRRRGMPLCFCGHTHVQMVYRRAADTSKRPGEGQYQLKREETYIVNPGSVGQPRDGNPHAAYGLWDPARGELETCRVPYDIDVTARAIQAAGLPDKLHQRLRVAA